MNLLFALLTLFFACVALWIARYAFHKIRGERNWPTVPGHIVERGVGMPMSVPGPYFLPRALYMYRVDGVEFTNDQVYLIRGTGYLRGKVIRLVNALPDTVPVHYDPTDPAKSYLLANQMSIAWIALVFGVFALLLGLLRLAAEFA